jgi:V-type ATPase 116kDa subunit family
VTQFMKISSVSCCLRIYAYYQPSLKNCHAASCVCSLLLPHGMQIKREKAVYHTLNKLSVDVTRKVLVGEAWVPASSRVRVQEAVRQVSEDSNSSVRPSNSCLLLLRRLLSNHLHSL